MPRSERGRTPEGFRVQVLARLQNQAQDLGISVQRLQRRIAFERFLARIADSGDWVLKGGLALEFRYAWRSRPTIDIDLRTSLDRRQALTLLRAAIVSRNGIDPFTFQLTGIEQELQGAPGGTSRVRVVASVAGRQFSTFVLDLSSGDALEGAPELFQGSDLLGFAGIAPVRFPIYPVAQHLAEKLHAYTLPRVDENTRVKDLLDMLIIAGIESIKGAHLMRSVHATFAARGTHAVAPTLPAPPASWAGPYRRLAAETPLAIGEDLASGYDVAARFWDPVLTDNARTLHWDPSTQAWAEAPDSEG